MEGSCTCMRQPGVNGEAQDTCQIQGVVLCRYLRPIYPNDYLTVRAGGGDGDGGDGGDDGDDDGGGDDDDGDDGGGDDGEMMMVMMMAQKCAALARRNDIHAQRLV